MARWLSCVYGGHECLDFEAAVAMSRLASCFVIGCRATQVNESNEFSGRATPDADRNTYSMRAPKTRSAWTRLRAHLVFASAVLASCAARSGGAQNLSAGPSDAEPFSGVFVPPEEAATAVASGALLLDARPAAAFLLRHPADAVHVRWDEFSDQDARGRLNNDVESLARALERLGVSDERATVVIGGWDSEWGEEGRIYWMLRSLGAEDVAIVEGGFAAWTAAGLDTERGPSRPQTGTFTPSPTATFAADIGDLSAFDRVLDVRSRAEYDGATPYGSERGGHIPGATHFDWTWVLDDDARLLSPEALRAALELEPGERVVAYCTGGVRSAFVWAALEHAGFSDAANYAGSWWEYANSELPVE